MEYPARLGRLGARRPPQPRLNGEWIELPLPPDAVATAGRTSYGLSYGTPGVIAQVASAEDVAHAPELVLTYQSGTPAPVRQGQVTKVLTIVEENHGYDQSLSSMPYLKSLGTRYGYATNYHALTHPSLPNYLALAGGSTFGETTNCAVSICPADHTVRLRPGHRRRQDRPGLRRGHARQLPDVGLR